MTVRRLKTYVAQTGFVYEYYYVGKRAALNRTILSLPRPSSSSMSAPTARPPSR